MFCPVRQWMRQQAAGYAQAPFASSGDVALDEASGCKDERTRPGCENCEGSEAAGGVVGAHSDCREDRAEW